MNLQASLDRLSEVVRNQAVKQDGVAAANALQSTATPVLNGPKIKTRSTPLERKRNQPLPSPPQ